MRKHNMKKNITRISYIALSTLFVLIAVYALSTSIFAEDNTAMHNEIAYDHSPQEISALSIPEKFEFAGEIIDLGRHDLRERFDRELMAFTYMHSTIFLLIKRANQYFPIIEPILKKNNIPDDFKYLAAIESYLSPRAASPAGAIGVWQFLADTARECGLEVNKEVDERLHLEKATNAACRYLQSSYDMYGDWMTTAASYNAGRRRISIGLEEQKAENYFGLYLNEETSRYVFRLMAAKEVMSNPKKYGLHLKKEDFYHTVRTKEVDINAPVKNWADWAKANETDFVQLKYFNPWIRNMKLDNLSKKTYKVKIPYHKDLEYDISKVKIHNKAWIK